MKNIIFHKLYLTLAFFLIINNSFASDGFIKNKGQFPNHVLAKKKINGGALFVEQGKMVFSFYNQKHLKKFHDNKNTDSKISFHSYSISFRNISKNLTTTYKHKYDYKENYYLGEKQKWASNVPIFNEVLQENIYKGIDLRIYNHDENLKYDLILSKGADVSEVIMKYQHVESLTLVNGSLLIQTSVNTIKEMRPYAYQIINNDTIEVKCDYVVKKQTVGFKFPQGFNSNFSVIIDPTLIFSTYSGSISDNFGYTATYDNKGYLYSGSTAFGVDYPVTFGAYQQSFQGGITDIAITKYDTLGTSRIYSTYLGGSADELPHSLVVSSNDELFILGTTGSSDFPVTQSAYNSVFLGGNSFFPTGLGVSFANGSDIFISRLSSNGGSLLSSTFLGGSDNDGLNTSSKLSFNYADEIRGEIDIDSDNNVYIASSTLSSDFPTSSNSFQSSFQGSQDGCIVKMDNQLSTIIWSSFIGGDNDDALYSLAIDNSNNIYLTGGTISTNFPTTALSYNPTYNDSINPDAFISKINPSGTQILSSSYFGSENYDQSYFIELNNDNMVYIFGQTQADSLSLVKNSNYYIVGGGQFISIFNNDISQLIKSTMIGTGNGSPDISPTAFLVDKCNNIYISGWGSNLGGSLSTLNLPITSDAYQNTTDGNDFYLAVINENLDSLEYATYFGGSLSTEHVDGGTSRFDKNGVVYQSVCAGCGNNNDFPIYPNPGAVSATNNSTNCNNAVFKFDFKRPVVVADFLSPILNCTSAVDFVNTSSTNQLTNISYYWDFGDGNFSNSINPIHQYQSTGVYDVKLIVTSPQACNISDTISKSIYVLSGTNDSLPTITKCPYSLTQIGLPPVNDSNLIFSWTPFIGLNNSNTSNPFSSSDTNIIYQLIISGNQCNDTLTQQIIINNLISDPPEDTSYCNTPILLNINPINNLTSVVWSSDNIFSDTLSNQLSFTASYPQTVYIKANDSLCSVIDSVSVLADLIDVEIDSDSLVCFADTAILSVINNTPINPIVSYNWLPSDFDVYNLDSSVVKKKLLSSTWYSLEVVNSVGCSIKDSVFITSFPLPVLDSLWANQNSLIVGSTAIINAISSDSLIWFDNSSLSQISFQANFSNWHNVSVFNSYCLIKDSIYISVRDLFCNEDSIIIPTGFTPNDDDINDVYKIQNNGVDIINFELMIFNRLGQLVYSSNNINNSWDGMFKGNKLLPQVFDFYLEMTCYGGKVFFRKGNITLIK